MTVINLDNKKLKTQQDPLLQQVLQIHDEPDRYFDDLQIRHKLTAEPMQNENELT